MARSTLRAQAIIGDVTTLVRAGQLHEDDIDALAARATDLEAAVRERVSAIGRTQADLAAFKVRYRDDVGLLHEELDELEAAIAEAEVGTGAAQANDADAAAASATPRIESAPRFTSDAVRRLFRDVAKIIHPDLARDDHTRDRRHALMVEANRAYALGDGDRLRSILRAWEQSPEAVQGIDPESTRLRLRRRIAQLEEQLNACADELAALGDSPLGQLKTMVDEAAARGKDLVADMVKRLRRDIMVARNRLDAINHGATAEAHTSRRQRQGPARRR